MSLHIKKVEYYNFTLKNHVEEGSKLLTRFAAAGINLLAFKTITLESGHTRFTLFPEDSPKMAAAAKQTDLELNGPYLALLIESDDQSGALADIYKKLSQNNITVNEASGIADINGAYGVVLYFDKKDCEKAMNTLKI